jgi:hypothetical protein
MADPAYIVDGVLTDGEAWVGITTTTLGSDTATITFTSTDDGQVGDFSQYMDLVVITYARSTAVAADVQLNMKLNGDAGGSFPNYTYAEQSIRGYGTGANAAGGGSVIRLQPGEIPAASATANQFGVAVITFFDINSGKYKSGISQTAADRDGAGSTSLWAFTWKSQAPLTEIALQDVTGSGDFLTGSSFSLFGVLPRMVA